MLHYRIHHTQPQATIYSRRLKLLQVNCCGRGLASLPPTYRRRISFTGFFFGFFTQLLDRCRENVGPKQPWISLAIIIIKNHSLWALLTSVVNAFYNSHIQINIVTNRMKSCNIHCSCWKQSSKEYTLLLYCQMWIIEMPNIPNPLHRSVGQVAQAARRWATGWTARVRSRVSEGWRFFFALSCPDWSWGPLSLL